MSDGQQDQHAERSEGEVTPPEHHHPERGRFGRGWVPVERDIGLPGECGPYPLLAPAQEGARTGYPDGGDGGAFAVGRMGLASRRGDGEDPGGAGVGRAAGEDLSVLASTQFTPVRQVRFLDCLAQDGNVRAACARVGVSRECVYRLKRRDAVFARGWAAALVLAREAAAELLADRAVNGIEEAIWYRGELVGVRRRHDSRLLLAHMARLDRVAEEGLAGHDAARFDELLAKIAGAAPDADLMPFHDWARDEDAPVLPCDRTEYASRAARHAHYAIRHASGDLRDGRTIEEMDEDWARADAIARGEAVEEPEPEPLPEPEEAWAAAVEAWDDWQDEAIAAVDAALAGEGACAGVMEFKSAAAVLRSGGECPPLPRRKRALHRVRCVNIAAHGGQAKGRGSMPPRPSLRSARSGRRDQSISPISVPTS
jgi:hypothetical protein